MSLATAAITSNASQLVPRKPVPKGGGRKRHNPLRPLDAIVRNSGLPYLAALSQVCVTLAPPESPLVPIVWF